MMMLLIAVIVCVVGCAGALIAMAMRRYPHVKAGFQVGRSGFFIEADDQGDD